MISVNLMLQLIELFNEKKWEKYEYLLNKYIEMLEKLNEKEQKVILELSKEFIWIKYTEYLEKIKEILSKIYLEEKFKEFRELYIIPLLNLEEVLYDENLSKTKSSNFMCYLFKSHELQEHIFLKGKKIIIVEKPYCLIKENSEIKERMDKKFPEKIATSSKKAVILVDDFIGSGKTALSAISYLEEKNIPKEKIIILSLAILSEGYRKISELGIKVYFNEYIRKSIAENSLNEFEKEDKKVILKEIMKKLKIKLREGQEFGYENSECLISLIRTPNNTIPIFQKFIFPR